MAGYYVSSGTGLFDQLFSRRPPGLGRSGKGINSWRDAMTKMQGLVDNPDYLDQIIRAGKFQEGFGITEFNPETGMFGGEAELKQRRLEDREAGIEEIGSGIHWGASEEEAAQAQALFRQLMKSTESRMRTVHRTTSWEASPLQAKMGSQGELLQELVKTKAKQAEARHTRGLI